MTPVEVLQSMQEILRKVIETGLSDEQNFPSTTQAGGIITEISIPNAPDLAVSMRNIEYAQIYAELKAAGAYHIQMIDGALIQMCYRFGGGVISAHRLCVFPAPNLDHYDSDPEIYDEDQMFADIVGRNLVHVPLRFDFDRDPTTHVEVSHPKSHLTLGQYPNCRIPVNAPLSPARFMKFVLRNFYFSAFSQLGLDEIDSSHSFEATATPREFAITHLVC